MSKLGPMYFQRLIAVVTAIAFFSPSAAANPTVLRQPTAKWVVNYDDAQCLAYRDYGEAGKPFHLVLKPSPLGNILRLMLLRDGGKIDAVQRAVTLRVGNAAPIKAKSLSYSTDAQRKHVDAINLSVSQLGALRSATSLEIKGPKTMAFALSDMGPLMRALDRCTLDLQRVWNVTPVPGGLPSGWLSASQRPSVAIVQRAEATPPLHTLFDSQYYPHQALRQDESGATQVVVMVDEKGVVRDCMVEQTSGIATLDAMSCMLIQAKAKYRPAIGSDGKPARSADFTTIRWIIGRRRGD